MEILAVIKLAQQNKEDSCIDDIIGKINVNNYNLDNIISLVYDYYSSRFKHHEWSDKDYKDCALWVNKALMEHNGMFDPRLRNIVQPEQHFDIVIDKPWADYRYETDDGILEGKLAIKGTVDLITKVNDSTLEVIDWKSGKRLDWATGQEKTMDKLYLDPQLKIYHYALSKLYPEYDNVIMSINFINDGGAFSVCFGKKDLSSTEDLIRKKFESIKSCKKPKLNKTWKCTKLCHFGKTTFADSDSGGILPILEYRDSQSCANGSVMTKCEQIKHDIEIKGLKEVVKEYKNPDHCFAKYKAPGSTS